MPADASPGYVVLVDDNFHYMDADARYRHGTFPTAETAVAACRAIVDQWLRGAHRPGMSAADLLAGYKRFGEDPFVVSPPGAPAAVFSGWSYARDVAAALCAEPPPAT